MFVERISLRSFRSYERAELELGSGVTVICGANGSGKTNLIEALYFGCTGRSCRTTNERELVRFGDDLVRVEADVVDGGVRHRLAAGLAPGNPKHMTVDADPVDSLLTAPERPLLSVFLPERMELVKGAPGLRRAHLDSFVAALWPNRAETRRAFGRALAQRNALLGRIRSGLAGAATLDAWDEELSRCAAALIADRTEATATLMPQITQIGAELGLPDPLTIAYRSQNAGRTATELAGWLAERRNTDIERGFTQAGPHRDELVLRHGDRELRTYGSQGQHRVGLLALLLAERAALTRLRDTIPILLLDDVLSELDVVRRELLVGQLAQGGQTLLTTTEIEHLPASARARVDRVEVAALRGSGATTGVAA